MKLADETTLLQEVRKAFSHIDEMQKRLDFLNTQLAERTDYESDEYRRIIDSVTLLTENLAMEQTENHEAEMEKTLLGLGFVRNDFNRPTAEFSGGWRMRVELAKLLLQHPDVLLLDDNSITSLQVLFFDGDGKYLSETGVEQSKITGSGSTYEVTLPILPTAASVQLVANFGRELGGDAAAVAMTGDPNSRADIVFFGEASLASLEKENPSVTLTRSVARTEIIATAPDFEIEQVRFYGTPSKGLVGCEQASAPNLPAGISYAAEGADMATDGTPYYHYEAEAISAPSAA